MKYLLVKEIALAQVGYGVEQFQLVKVSMNIVLLYNIIKSLFSIHLCCTESNQKWSHHLQS